ncbi:hypothetical protein FSS13T_18830 [Flavobacterium saliperosum S13]|uniref:Uncharacterized protein n=2 Tax=Flavobacterium saliperosum TaxID=329186 RepID=A0A1G4W8U2_9FLAO|nr:hypothetical protein [Flavobacterium saliperosum]ESU24985.1 hypothetical protein FSS13T_18830 [Flavobacterium saliperosum S13]SCX18226.1 hypothetical protein SAMN02927925_02645 [Flavobacterium saliperosum]
MKNEHTSNGIGWALGLLIFAIGVMNLLWVHPVPTSICILISLVYFPPIASLLKQKIGLSIPLPVKIILAIVIIWFTLGVSDLGDMIDDL